MKNKLAKILRAWADRLSPQVQLRTDYVMPKLMTTDEEVLNLQRYRVIRELQHGLNDRETEFALQRVKADSAKELAELIKLKIQDGYITGNIYIYA